ncbi:MAG TPA: cation transporter [Phycisphaerales bacterium]|nr:cation transporter [Phycisphaerales bacterium]
MNTPSRIALPFLLVAAAALIGCAGSPGSGAAAQGENAFVHEVRPEDADRLKDTSPIKSDRVRLYVNGMGCPQCVSNIDLQLAKVRGVRESKVNLSNGTVDVDLYTKDRPSPAQISRAVGGDFTLIRIEELK